VSTPAAAVQRWARLRRDIQCVLRRGAWYAVRSVGPDEAVLEVDNAAVRVPRDSLEITETRPNRWTVVPRPCRGGQAARELGVLLRRVSQLRGTRAGGPAGGR